MEARLKLEILFKNTKAHLSTAVPVNFIDQFFTICNSWHSKESKHKDFYEDDSVRMWLVGGLTGKDYEKQALAREAELLQKPE